jgi:hypothetical protein
MGIYLSEEATSPGTPPSGTQRLYPKSDGKWYTKQDDGTETEVALVGVHTHAAGDIASGTLDAARIPDLSATKITSGTLAAARVPDLDASKIASGTLAAARVPDLDASKIASGTLAAARVPDLDASKIASGTLAAARVPAQLAGVSTGTMSNNTAVSFATDSDTGFLLLHTVTNNISYAELLYCFALYCTDSSSQYLIVLNSGSYVETTTGVLSGTTGTDGMLALSAASGSIYVENRTHMTLECVVTMIGQA